VSRIYFTSPSDDAAELCGSERARMSIGCGNHLVMALQAHRPAEFFIPHLPENSYLRSYDPLHDRVIWTQRFSTWLRVAGEHLIVDGVSYDTFTLALNTVLASDNDAIKLMARLHGQCEIHCYVEGQNREWLAKIIEKGRADILRSDQGWEDVSEMLRWRDDEPVVCSYSVSDEFPNYGLLPVDHPINQIECDEKYRAWDDLPNKERWECCMTTLRSMDCMEIKPDDWDTFYFGPQRMNGYQLYDAMLAENIKNS
jgi:hypothetical protein